MAHVLQALQFGGDTAVIVINADVGKVLRKIFFLPLELGEKVAYPVCETYQHRIRGREAFIYLSRWHNRRGSQLQQVAWLLVGEP